MPITRRALHRPLLLAVLLAAGGCSKLDKVFADPPGARLPDAPFSLDCRLHKSYIGSGRVDPSENPA